MCLHSIRAWGCPATEKRRLNAYHRTALPRARPRCGYCSLYISLCSRFTHSLTLPPSLSFSLCPFSLLLLCSVSLTLFLLPSLPPSHSLVSRSLSPSLPLFPSSSPFCLASRSRLPLLALSLSVALSLSLCPTLLPSLPLLSFSLSRSLACSLRVPLSSMKLRTMQDRQLHPRYPQHPLHPIHICNYIHAPKPA